MYVLINKSQLNNNVNSEVNFQKMRIPLFMLYSKLVWSSHVSTTCDFTGLCRSMFEVFYNLHY